jgi:hypothetical protein
MPKSSDFHPAAAAMFFLFAQNAGFGYHAPAIGVAVACDAAPSC